MPTDRDANDFQNLINSCLSAEHLWRNFKEDMINNFYVKLLTDRQTERQVNRQTPCKHVHK